MAYTANNNLNPATGKDALFNIKAALVAAGWIVRKSGTGAAYNATGDSLTSSSAFGTRSWFVIEDPLGKKQFCIQAVSTTSPLTARVKFSRGAKFTGGSPDATTTPSASDEYVLTGAGTDASPTGAQWMLADGTMRQNVMAGGAAENYAVFAWVMTSGAPNKVAYFLLHDPFVAGSYPAEDTEPWVVAAGANVGFPLENNWGNATSPPPAGYPATIYKAGLAGEVSPAAINIIGAMATGIGSNPYNSKDDLFPVYYGRSSGANVGFRGTSTVFRWSPVLRTMMDAYSVNSTRDFVVVTIGTASPIGSGSLVAPWNGSAPVL